MSGSMSHTLTRGVIYVHSASAALCPHLVWAVQGVLGHDVAISWTPQPAAPRLVRGEYAWTGPIGTGAEIVSALRGWDHLRFEVTEHPTATSDGSRWQYTPSLGVHHSQMSFEGESLVSEDRLREAVLRTRGDSVALRDELDHLLGEAWDAELEVFRHAGEGAAVRWLTRVG